MHKISGNYIFLAMLALLIPNIAFSGIRCQTQSGSCPVTGMGPTFPIQGSPCSCPTPTGSINGYVLHLNPQQPQPSPQQPQPQPQPQPLPESDPSCKKYPDLC